MYGFHLIPIYNRAQFVDKTDPCCSAHAGRGGVDRCLHGMPSGYNARDPFFGPCWRCTCLSVLTLGMQCLGDAVTTMLLDSYQTERASISLPGKSGQAQASGQSDTWATEGIIRVCNGGVQRSDGEARVDTDLIHPLTRECATDAAGGLPML